MQPEWLTIDVTLTRGVQGASAPLLVSEGAIHAGLGGGSVSEQDSPIRRAQRPLQDCLWRRGGDHQRRRGLSWPFGERRHDRRVLADRTPQSRARAVGRRAGRVSNRACRETVGGLDRSVWTGFLSSEGPVHAPVLPLIPTPVRFARHRLAYPKPPPSK